MSMEMNDVDIVGEFIRACDDGWRLGWHERNGGNLTYRMTAEDVEACLPFFRNPGQWVPMPIMAENLAGEFFMASGSGKFMRNATIDPEDSMCLLEINGAGDAWRILWGLSRGGMPTSEFPSHFLNHSVRKEASAGRSRVIYHAHTPAVIALTFILRLDARSFTSVLWRSATECPVVFPRGVGVVDWMVPGGPEIAYATSELMMRHEAVVWAHHGLFCAGDSFDAAFGLMHTIEKAADIYLRVLSSGKKIRQTIGKADLRAIARAFNVDLDESLM